MASFAQWLEETMLAREKALDVLSRHWDAGVNRRTMIILIAFGVLALSLWLSVLQPPSQFPVGKLVSVPQGGTLSEVADILKAEDVIRSPLTFRLIMTLYGSSRTAQAGDYLFNQPLGLLTITRAISVGEFGLEPIRIRVPEGATVQEMSIIFPAQLQRFSRENFLAQSVRMEGYLFPDTYFFLPNATEDIVIQTMRQNFDGKIAPIIPTILEKGHTLEDIVILASILENEAYNSKDRKLISGVLWNRLERDMPLQVDAVFGYSLGKGTFQLTVADLTDDSPYNTYKHKGLPPTPIGNPSLDSIMAAIEPTESDYLYFLADRRGVTHYCKTYACQLANKAKYFK